MSNTIKNALHIAKLRRLSKGPKIADIKGVESSPLMKLRKSIPYTTRENFALGGQPVGIVPKPVVQPVPAPVAAKPAVAPVATKPAVAPIAMKPAVAPVAAKPAVAPVAAKPAVAPVATKPAVAPVDAASTTFLKNVYNQFLNRDPNASETSYWGNQLRKGSSQTDVASAIANDPGVVIGGLYQDYLGRGPNQDEFNYWQGEMKKGRTAAQVDDAIFEDVSKSNFIKDQYLGLMGRDPNPKELKYWRDQMNRGTSPGKITNIISNDPGSKDYLASNFGAYQVAGNLPSGKVTNQGLRNNYVGRVSAIVGNLGNQARDRFNKFSDAVKNFIVPVAGAESNGNPTAGAKTSSAKGLFQFTTPTWDSYFKSAFGNLSGLPQQLIHNLRTEDSPAGLEINKYLAGLLAADSERKLKEANLPVTNETLYAMHFGGDKGGPRLIKGYLNNPNSLAKTVMDPKAANANRRLANMPLKQLFEVEFAKKLSDPVRLSRAQAALTKYSDDAPTVASQPIMQEITPARGGGGSSTPGDASTQKFLNQYLYDNVKFQPGTNVINPGGGSSDAGVPRGASGSSSSALTPGSHAGTHGAPAIPTVHHPVSHGSGSVSFAPPASSGGGSGTIDPYFGHAGSTRYDPRWGSGVGGPSSDWEIDYARKRGGSVTHDNIRKRGIDALQTYASGGKVWEKKRPKSLGKPEKLDKDQKRSAKAAAKAAGRPYPNLIDNMRAAQKADGGEIKAAIKLAHKRLTHES